MVVVAEAEAEHSEKMEFGLGYDHDCDHKTGAEPEIDNANGRGDVNLKNVLDEDRTRHQRKS